MQHIFCSLKESPGNNCVCVSVCVWSRGGGCPINLPYFFSPPHLPTTATHICISALQRSIEFIPLLWKRGQSTWAAVHLLSKHRSLFSGSSLSRFLSAKFYKENWVLWRTHSAHLHFPSQAGAAVARLQRILSWKVSKAVIISIPEYISF